ncbi:hypothetical protein SAMN05421812_101544 [Asanoa hainanensis]|uniref:Uncharacterized protein n=1 Tax=Asanoa hainanensis TaxID=560556 RepID=A0A239GT32_9ACTN|nr:hypothetical protein SAMN05421812_101544 [Asanoa hainanensis]
MFEAAVTRALASPEIKSVLVRLAAGRADRHAELEVELTEHVRRGWAEMRALVAVEADAYEAADTPTNSRSVDQSERSRAYLEDLTRELEGLPPIAELRAALVSALVERAVLPAVREWINLALARDRHRRYRARFEVADTSGLRQMSAPEHELATGSFARLDTLMRQIGGGAIGISGPRGIGKSTLVRSACGPDWFGELRTSLGVFVPAPVEYVPREFLLHLFASLCLRVSPYAEEPDEPRRAPAVPAQLVVFGVIVAAVGGVVLLATGVAAARSAPTTVAGVGGALAVAGALLALRPRLRISDRDLMSDRPRWRTPVEHLARRADRRTMWVLLVLAVLAFAAIGAGWLVSGDPRSHTYLSIAGLILPVLVAYAALDGDAEALPRAARVGVLGSLGLLVAGAVVTGATAVGDRLAVVVFVVGAVLASARTALRHLSLPLPAGQPLDAGLTSAGVAAISAGLAASAAVAWSTSPHAGLVWGPVLLAGCFGFETARRSWRTMVEGPPRGPFDPHAARARAELRRIRYQQTVTTGWADAIKIGALPKTPLAVEHSVSGGESMARVPLTYPEIVAAFHAYVASLTRDGAAVVIGIDELDKLAPEAAVRFMNDIKAIFEAHVPGCYFLVSVSEEALAGFTQRGLPTRDVFDTAFDEMLRLAPLSYDATVAMLAKRVIDLPRGVAVLCHALAGGLPRDVIRVVRATVAARDRTREDRISDLARRVCTEQAQAQLHALRTAARAQADWRQVVAITDWADTRTIDDVAQVANLPKEVDDPAAVALLRAHATSLYHLATVATFLGTAGNDERERVETGVGVETLALARAEMAASWALAWRRVSEFRAAWGMVVIDPPES